MENKSLLGKWKLVKNGSDFLPGLDSLPEAPLVLKMLGNSDVEFFKIEKRKFLEVEEIMFTYVTRNTSISKSYQLCSLNIEGVVNTDVNLAIVKSLSEDFTEVAIVRMGPKTGQCSHEHFKLDIGTGEVRIKVEITTADGTRFNLIKYLARFDESGESEADPIFQLSTYTMGWSLFDIWPSTMLSNATISIVKALKVKCQDSKAPLRIIDTPWAAQGVGETPIDLFAITRSLGSQLHDGIEVVMFVIKVTVGESTWYVAHRYREFDALRKFLLSQNPFTTSFQENDARFPGKNIFHSAAVLEQRAKALSDFLSLYLTDARYCRQNSLEALLSFLQLPEHLYEVAKQKLQLAREATANEVAQARANDNATSVDETTEVNVRISPKSFFATAAEATTSPTSGTGSSAAAVSPTTTSGKPTAVASPVRAAATATAAPAPASSGSHSSPPQPLAIATRGPAVTSPQQKLLAAMGEKGLAVIKHGRQGAPKRRSLFLSPDGSQLVIQAEDHYKTIKLAGVTSVRLGTAVDPATNPAVLEKLKSEGGLTADALAKRRSASRSTLLGGHKNEILFGTSNLRRSCDPKRLDMCVSLILPTRTVDFECLAAEDVSLLQETLTQICAAAKPSP